MKTIQTDVAVIGAGTAGLAAYRAAKAAGARTVHIEGGPYGTTCARVGCMPSKLLIAAAEASHAIDTAPGFGLHIDGHKRVNGREVMARVRGERDRFVGFVLEGVDKTSPEDRLIGHAKFLDPGTLEIDGHTRVEARAIVIATGSRPSIPDSLKGLGDRLVVNDDVFSWQDLPRSVAVLGPGVIGLELGQALHRLGVRVVVLGRGGRLGPITDPEVRDVAEQAFKRELRLEPDARPGRIERQGDEVLVEWHSADGASHSERFDYLLVATGRVPNVDRLAIDRAGVALDGKGVPLFDKHTLQAGTSAIFIAGDAANDIPLLHEAADEGRIAGENAARFPNVAPGPQARRHRRGVQRPADRGDRRRLARAAAGKFRHRARILRRPGPLAGDACQQGRAPCLRRTGIGTFPGGGDGRAARRAHRAFAFMGGAEQDDHREDARDALLPPGDRGRPAHGAARPRRPTQGTPRRGGVTRRP